MIFGHDSSLQAGYLNQASGTNSLYQLYSTFGVGIGVSRVTIEEEKEIAFQLWSLPSTVRYQGLTNNFLRGASATILVLKVEDLIHAEGLLELACHQSQDPVMIVVIGSLVQSSETVASISSILGNQLQIQSADSVAESLSLLARALNESGKEPIRFPFIAVLSEESCPEFEPQPGRYSLPLSTDDEVKTILNFANELNAHIVDNEIQVNLSQGRAFIEPRSEASICIVGLDSGWSSEGVGKRALLTMAKINAFASQNIPNHVRKQLLRASNCPMFKLSSEIEPEVLSELKEELNLVQGNKVPTLLDAARKRVEDGRLPSSAYDILKSSLQKVETLKEM
ncbi:MAG: hypothetical protein ACW97A_08265 [Candidatus Thorarchaeota archaeon]